MKTPEEIKRFVQYRISILDRLDKAPNQVIQQYREGVKHAFELLLEYIEGVIK